jgi:NitT/TauT family transport system ATP-binding protein
MMVIVVATTERQQGVLGRFDKPQGPLSGPTRSDDDPQSGRPGVTPPEIALRAVSKVYRTRESDVTALAGVDILIRPGEFVALLGPSGCGKSTLLNLIAGLDAPSDGVVQFDGKRRERPDPSVTFCFQEPALFPWRTVLGNVGVALEAAGVRKKEASERAHDAVVSVGLEPFVTSYPKALSGGMKQRAVLARALAMRSPVLLLDEPFAALDAFTRETMQTLVLDLYAEMHFTCVLVTHSIEEALFMAQRVVVMASRPSRVVEEVPVVHSYPRDYSWRTCNEFVEMRKHLHNLIASQ